MNTKIITLDINKKIFEPIIAKQGDTASRFLLFNLYDNGVAFNLTGRTVRAYAIKPDGTKIYNDLVINDTVKGICTLELTTQMLAVEGLVSMELVVMEGTKKLSSIPFVLNVIKSLNADDAVISTNEFTVLQQALASVQNIDNRFEDVNASLETKLNKDGIVTMANMGQDVKEAMTGGSVAVVGKNSVLSENIVDRQVTTNKLSRLYADGYVGKNKFNKDNVKNGYYIDPTTGTEKTSSGNSVSDFIAVENIAYYFSNLFTGARYDSNYNYIDGTANVGNWNGVAMPSTVKYIKISCINTNLSKAQMEIGTSATSYEEYKHFAKNVEVADKSITPSKLDRIYAQGELGKNLFDKSNIKMGYVNPTNGTISSSTDNFYYELTIDSKKTYCYTDFQLGAYYDENGVFISGSNNVVLGWNGKIVPTNAKTIKVSANISKLSSAQIEIGLIPTGYEPYGFYPLGYGDTKVIKYNTINVPTDFGTITLANNSITTSSYYNRYNIILANGTYIEKDIYLKPFVTLIGKDRDKTIIKGELPASATDDQITPSSTINLIYSNGLKNLTVTCKNMRYPIHDDGGGTDKERLVENCKFIHYGNDEAREYRVANGLGGTVWESENAYGSGVNSGDNFLFKNCEFIGTINAWGTHNNVGYSKSAYIEHDNCIFTVTKDGSNSMGIASMGSGNIDKIVFKGCSANAPIKYFTMGTDIISMPKKSEFEITGHGNDIPLLNNIDNDFYTSSFTDEVLKLSAKENILIGQVCCYDADMRHIRKMLPTDSILLFVGVALENINVGAIGAIKKGGYIQDKICGFTNSSFGKKYGVNSNSYLAEVSSNELLLGVGYNQLKFI